MKGLNKNKLVILVIALSLMLLVMSGCMASLSSIVYVYDDSTLYSVGAASFVGEKVTDLDISWLSGKVEILNTNDTTVEIYESYTGTFEDSDKLHFYLNESGCLIIKFRESSSADINFNYNLERKKLFVKIPAEHSFGKIKIHSISAEINIYDQTAEEIKVDTVSGGINIKSATASVYSYFQTVSGSILINGEFASSKISTISGKISFTGKFELMEVSSVSGGIDIDATEVPTIIKADTVSGNVLLKIPMNDGFLLTKDTTSGNFKCEFDLVWQNKTGKFGLEEDKKFNLKTVSGNINIKMKEKIV